jgi:hypothetical protein
MGREAGKEVAKRIEDRGACMVGADLRVCPYTDLQTDLESNDESRRRLRRVCGGVGIE